MGDVKPWHIILILAAIGALGFSAWKFAFTARVPDPDRILLVDVKTGVLFDTRKGKNRGLLLPARHPETGDPTLFPVEKDESGSWVIRSRYRPMLSEMRMEGGAVNGSFVVRVTDETPVRYVVPLPEE